ncbi:MAG: response regulator, partial [Thermoanaerobaculia bacterium]|nr:response regulator [Thermoanaerobaculia bacterium]
MTGSRESSWLRPSVLVLAAGIATLLLIWLLGRFQLQAWEIDSTMARSVSTVRRELEVLQQPESLSGPLPREHLAQLKEALDELALAAGLEDEAADRAVREEATAMGQSIAELLDHPAPDTLLPLLESLRERAGEVEGAVAFHSAEHRHWARRLLVGALQGWGLIIALVVALLATWERRRAAEEREIEESRDRMVRAQKMDAVGRLAGGIAHDINNHLASIRAHTELVLHRPQTPAALERKMNLILETVLKASSLLERLLTFGGRQPTQSERLDLNDVVSSFETVLRGAVPDAIDLEFQLAPNLESIHGNVSQIEQLLANLVVNARDAIQGKGRIVVSTRSQVADGKRINLLSVSDDGCGIPIANQDKVFDPFFTTKAGSGSSGLGLAAVYATAEQSGWTIGFESTPGEGTTFLVSMSTDEKPARGPVEPRGGEPDDAPRGEESLLLVDDNEVLADAAATFLSSLGYRVRLAKTLSEARSLAAENPFDLVICDVQLPDGSGADLLSELRQQRPTKALYMSGYTDRIALRSGLRSDEAFFVKKPFSVAGLSRMVRRLL